MTRRSGRALAALALVWCSGSCDGTGEALDAAVDARVDAGRDASRDAARPDADRDAARDVGTDSPRDAAVETTWTRIATGLPDVCVIERADHPEAMESLRLAWSPCADGTACLRSTSFGRPASWWAVDGELALGVLDDGAGHEVLIVAPLDGGAVIGAYRSAALDGSTPFCAIYHADMNEGRVGLAVRFAAGGTLRGAAFWSSPISDFGTWDNPVFDDREHFIEDAPQSIYVSSDAFVIDAQPVDLLYEISTGAVVPVFVTADFSSTFESIHVAGDRIFWDAYPRYAAWGRAGVRGGEEYFRTTPPWEMSTMWTDGHELTWLASHIVEERPDGSSVRAFELWTGNVTADPSEFAPRRVRALDAWDFPIGGPGAWAVTRGRGGTDPYRVELYDLSDGRRRTFVAPSDDLSAVGAPLEVTRERVVYAAPGASGVLVQFDPRSLPYDVE